MAARRKTKSADGSAAAPKRRGRPPGKSPLAGLRLAAKAAYTLSYDPIDIDDLADDPDYADVGRSRMRQWAVEGDWDAERAKACRAWRQRAEGSLGAAFLRRQTRQMQLLAHLHDEAVRLRCQQAVQPRSWESVANVQLKAADLMRQYSRDHAQALAQLGAPAANTFADKSTTDGSGMEFGRVDDLTDEETRIGAHAILRRKMQERLADKAANDEEKKVIEPTPIRRAAGA